MTDDAPRDNLRGGGWLLADMSLNIWALSIVKWLGADYTASQIVFLRALTGLVLIAPLILRNRGAFRNLGDLHLHFWRVLMAVITLTASFFAISRIPFATVTALGFTRPLVTMVLAGILLRETVTRRQWGAAAIALCGVLIAVQPGAVPWNIGLAAMGVVVLAGSGTVIATRRLRAAPVIVMMAFYTAGLTVFSAPLALANWTPIQGGHLLPLLLVGVFAQTAQVCYLRAQYHGTAGFLSVLSYLSLVFSVSVGFFAFGERPTIAFTAGAALVILAAIWVTTDQRRPRLASR
ncbi:DMT family transporter [Oceanibium sediminis]|uniref:DMT family transporter n=1 Tax=Oceanibium sediminis TaxID=2026339 RepID=UPI000DD3E753|nr:DMT family transporter [Oceanibium sediminis]